jgi:transcriptional regulator with XRE-family HTH domain
MIGKYERSDNLPFIELAFKLTDIFNISMDYLLGKRQHASYNKDTIRRLEDIENLYVDTKKALYTVIDTFLRNFKTRQAYS